MLKKRGKGQTIPSSEFRIHRRDHSLSKANINPNALKVLNRLVDHRHQAYLVGGSVRDLLLSKTPKDFDVVTSAHPSAIRKLFKNCRIIGRRFKLAHIYFYRDLIEVATFRKADAAPKPNKNGMITNDNCYGTLEEDVYRRDLTINALYYDHKDCSIIDYVGGAEDIKQRQIRMIGEPTQRYQEDPVRMLRVLRFAAKLDFDIAPATLEGIAIQREMLGQVSSSRLFEEVVKIYHCGNARAAHQLLVQQQLLEFLFPATYEICQHHPHATSFIENTLENTDFRIKQGKPVTPAFMFASLLWFPLIAVAQQLEQDGHPPLVALEQAMGKILSTQQRYISIPKRLSQIIREIWLLQYKLPRRHGNRAFKTYQHPRFRAAYDFMLLRVLVGEEENELADWWTQFQEVDDTEKKKMIKAIHKKK